MMTLSWALIAVNATDIHALSENLLHHFGKTAEILIFLMGAMAIVEMIDEVLTHADQPAIIEQVRSNVKTMMERFPLYPDLH